MFQGLRAAMPFYILYKTEPRVAIGEVVGCSNPTQSFNAFQPSFPARTIDVKVRVGSEEIDFKQLPAESVIADYGGSGIVVSDSREAIMNEVAALSKTSENALADMDRHRHIVSECAAMLQELSPQLKREAEQTAEIENLKRDLSDIKEMLSKALGGGSKKTKEE